MDAAAALDLVQQAEKEAMEKLAQEEKVALDRVASILAELASNACTPRYYGYQPKSLVAVAAVVCWTEP